MSSEGHTHGSSKDELVVLKTVKTKNKKRVRESARIKGLLESRKKTRKTKNDVGLISTDKALSDTFYDNFHLKKHVVVKTKGLGEKKITKKNKEEDIRKARKDEARSNPPLKSFKSKQSIHVYASTVDHHNYVGRAQFQELH
ncbi:hypothetical protein M9H77_06904 [Catharanthus roseus]|uniref:Uncharacterized protein n=1 Tax=Catharanthus roseus TaxID=4058 RepID=A0ACC0BTL7_CATRO|nr:hypothetical protein M9H77_06904 [Catharanthus roseus]